MEAAPIQSLYAQVLWAALLVAFVFGAIAQRTNFCTMGAFSDIVNMGDWSRMRMWVLAVGVAILGFHAMVTLGWIDPAQTVYFRSRVLWLSALLGGALFGFGMVLASGCGSKTLVRIGGGSLKSLVVFVVMGMAAFATMHGVTAVAREQSVDRASFAMQGTSMLPLWLTDTLGWTMPGASFLLAALVALALIVWVCMSRDFLRSGHGWLAGLGIGATVVAMWWVTGSLAWVQEHPETQGAVFLATDTGRIQALSFTAPMARVLEWLLFFSDAYMTLTVGIVMVFGVILGAFVVSLASGSFRWEGFRDTQDTALHLVGAVCMGVGGVTAMGCTVGQGLSGLSTLSLVSLLAVAGIAAGAVAGLRFQLWLLERE